MEHTDDLVEDLVDLAAYEFGVAQNTCGQCRDYHALWGYERLARVKNGGFASERDTLGPLFRDHAPQNGRILIAGVADAGLLAFVAQETRSREPRITVADRCATPLMVCRRHAESVGLGITTAHADLMTEPFTPDHDLALAHNILVHVPLIHWDSFLRNTRRALDRNGVFILVHRILPSGSRKDPHLPPAEYADRTLAALRALSIPLPVDEAAFRRHLENYSVSMRSWAEPDVGPADIERCLIEAGFAIVRRIDHERRKTIPDRKGGEGKTMHTHIFVAANTPAA